MRVIIAGVLALMLAAAPLAADEALDCSDAGQSVTISPPAKIDMGGTIRGSIQGRTEAFRFSGNLVAPGRGKQACEVTCLRLVGWDEVVAGGFTIRSATLLLNIKTGDGARSASYDVYPAGVPIPTQGRPHDSVMGRYDISPGGAPGMAIQLDANLAPQALRFGATGEWFHRAGQTNTYRVIGYVEFDAVPIVDTPFGGGIRG